MWSLRIPVAVLVVTELAGLITCSDSASQTETERRDNSFDIYIFTLHWPYTTCLDWRESGHGHKCNKIESASWSVHGLWPTRMHQIAPNFCNNSWHYDHGQMEAIMGDMTRLWPDVEVRGVTDSLWSHEWTKHGTCAVQDKAATGLATQTEYFQAGLQLAEANPVVQWLAEAGVVASDGVRYTTGQVWDAVVTATGGFRPHIDCIRIEGEAYITEVKVCYTKNLTRVDCDGIKAVKGQTGDMMGTCLRYPQGFLYPSSSSPSPAPQQLRSTGGVVAGVVCGVLGAGAALLGAGYYIVMNYSRWGRGRGYESL